MSFTFWNDWYKIIFFSHYSIFLDAPVYYVFLNKFPSVFFFFFFWVTELCNRKQLILNPLDDWRQPCYALHNLLKCGWIVANLERKENVLQCKGSHDAVMLLVLTTFFLVILCTLEMLATTLTMLFTQALAWLSPSQGIAT